MMTINRFLSVSLAALATSIVFGAEVVYQNDFSTRTSKKPVPSDEWHEMKYAAPHPLAYSYLNGDYAVGVPYSDLKNYQDSWAKQKTSVTGQQGTFRVVSGTTDAKDNPCVIINCSECTKADDTATAVITPIYNDFTDGVVRISVDIRCRTGALDEGGYFRVLPLFKVHLDPDSAAKVATKICATAFGLEKSKKVVLLSNNSTQGPEGNADGIQAVKVEGGVRKSDPLDLTTGNWYRFVIDLDFAAKRAGGDVYDLGTDQPTLDTKGVLCGTFWKENGDGRNFYYQMTEERGPISGVALKVSKMKFGDKAVTEATDAPAYDNLTIAWKAPGAADFVSVYENDFATRRYRTVEPAGVLSHDYSRSVGSIEDEFTYRYDSNRLKSDWNLKKLVPDSDLKAEGLQVIGYDGWRRINKNGLSPVAAVDWSLNASGQPISGEEGGAVMRVTGLQKRDANNYVYVATPLGESLTSGKVSFCADVRIPEKWSGNSYLTRHDVGLMLSDASFYEATALGEHCAVRGGITGNKSDGKSKTEFLPYYNKAGTGWQSEDDCSLEPTNWYRIVITADLDNRQSGSSMKIWKLGLKSQKSTSPVTDSMLVFEKTGIPFRSSVTDIGSIGIYVAGAGVNDADDEGQSYNRQRFVCVDNLVVKKDVDTANEKTIYLNTFSTRTRTFDSVTSGTLIGTFNNTDGADHWIRRAGDAGEARIIGGPDNPRAAIWAVGKDSAYAVHQTGETVKEGAFQVDIRPPANWNVKDLDTRQLSVVVGGDALAQGCHDPTTDHAISYNGAMTFGFIDAAAKTDAVGVYTNLQLYVWNGSGTSSVARQYPESAKAIDPSHWYRFRASFNCKTGKWSLKVFDMGTKDPSVFSGNGEQSVFADDLDFRLQTPNGLSSYYLTSRGNAPALANDPNDPNMTLFDNVVVTESNPLLIILR